MTAAVGFLRREKENKSLVWHIGKNSTRLKICEPSQWWADYRIVFSFVLIGFYRLFSSMSRDTDNMLSVYVSDVCFLVSLKVSHRLHAAS